MEKVPSDITGNGHPVWEVYDLQRVVQLNVNYWTAKYISSRRWSFLLEYSLMATAPTSAITGLFLWQTEFGTFTWKCALIATAFLGVAKPLLHLSDRLQKLHEIVLGYKNLSFDLQEISNQIRRKKQYNATMIKDFQQIQKKIQTISQKEPIDKIDQKLRKKCYDMVLQELPIAGFYIPDE